MTMKKIEDLWGTLRSGSMVAQRRIDADHPLDLYADYEQPDRPGLVLFCKQRPPNAPSLKAISIDSGRRQDGSWSLRIRLEEPRLVIVFAELCRDIVESTRTGVGADHAATAVIARIDRWQTLLQARAGGLSRAELRGLIGELLVLETELLTTLEPDEAVGSWTGPLGTDQDFRLPTGRKIEVKALDHDAQRVQINGLGQLDAGSDPLEVFAVRIEETGRKAQGAITASSLIARLRTTLSDSPMALSSFNTLLRFAGWEDHAGDETFAVRLVRIDRFDVNAGFPRLTAAIVPSGVLDASYVIALPPMVIADDR